MRKRIGFNQTLISEHVGGARQRELLLFPLVARQLSENDVDVYVYISKDLGEDLVDRLIPRNCARIVRAPMPAVPTYKRVLKGYKYWKEQVALDRLSAFHTAYHPAPKLKIPVVTTIHDLRHLHIPDSYPWSRRQFLRWSIPLTIQRSSKLIAVSHDTKKDLIRGYGCPAAKVVVSPNCIDNRFGDSLSESELLRRTKKYKLPTNFILYVGHLEKRKNLERLCLAFKALCSQTDAKETLVLLGKPSYGGYDDMLKKNKLEDLRDRIIFTGFVDDSDLSAIYQRASLLAFPSLHEGFGIPILEAMACETPVLTSNVSALPEVAGDAAILVDPFCVNDITQGLALGLNDDSLRQSLIDRGLKRLDKYTPEKSCQLIVNALMNLLEV